VLRTLFRSWMISQWWPFLVVLTLSFFSLSLPLPLSNTSLSPSGIQFATQQSTGPQNRAIKTPTRLYPHGSLTLYDASTSITPGSHNTQPSHTTATTLPEDKTTQIHRQSLVMLSIGVIDRIVRDGRSAGISVREG